MNVTLETLSAVFRIAKHLANLDGEASQEEVKPLFEFYQTFDGMNDDLLRKIVNHANFEMTDERALQLITEMDDEDKQQIADLYATIVCADDEITATESEIYQKLRSICGLPLPKIGCPLDEGEEEEAPAKEDSDEDDGIIPAFMVIKSNGHARVEQSDNEDWSALGDELASWINADRVEIVRFTKPLNALSEKLSLNERHLVFMVDRNGAAKEDIGDNMPGTILYGSGYEIMGDIIIAIETDKGYEIEGIMSRSLLGEVMDAVDEAVDHLLIFD